MSVFDKNDVSGPFELVQRVDFIKKKCEGRNVLHLGCTNYPFTEDSIGNNMLLHFELAKVAARLTGIDADKEGLDELARRGDLELYQADLEALERLELSAQYDVIVGGEIIEHLSNPGLFLSGIKRFMSADTELIITTVNAYCAFRFLVYGLRGRRGRNEPVHPDHVGYYSYKTLTLALERQGLRTKEFYFYDIGREHRPFNRWFYNLFNDVCVRIWPQMSDGVIAVAVVK